MSLILAPPATMGAAANYGSRRPSSGRVMFIEDFRPPNPGVWNDGVGSASRDTDIMFSGMPSLRLDPQGQASGGITNPARTAITSGVVVKRRIHDSFSGLFGLEFWFRMTSKNLTSSAFFSASIYNRDGTNAYHSRVWFDPNGNNQPMVARILDGAATAAVSGTTGTGAATYTAVVTSTLQNGAGSHTYDPTTGSLDKAGGWHWAKLVTDMNAKKYVSLAFDSQPPVDLSAYTMDMTATTAFAGMHFSFEFAASTSTRPRYVNVAQMIGTDEG
jgi:hypothetical protein